MKERHFFKIIIPLFLLVARVNGTGAEGGASQNTNNTPQPTLMEVKESVVGVSNLLQKVADDVTITKGGVLSLMSEPKNGKAAKLLTRSEIGQIMEKATYQLEKYGSIHVSTPLLTSPTNDFHFNLRYGASNYFQDAKTNRQGGASFFEQTVQSFAARVGAQFDPTVAAAYTAELGQYYTELNRFQKKQSLGDEARQAQLLAELNDAGTNMQKIAEAQMKFASNYQAGATAPAFPTSQDVNVSSQFTNELARPDVTNTFASNKFAGFQGLLGTQGVEPTLDNRSAIIQAAGDNAIESIFYLLGNPKQADQFKKQRVFFGLVTVGVDPGWRTEKGFAAEAVVATEVDFKPARKEVILRFLKGKEKDNIPPEILAYLCNREGISPGEINEQLQPFIVNNSGTKEEEVIKTFNLGLVAAKEKPEKLVGLFSTLQETDSNSWGTHAQTFLNACRISKGDMSDRFKTGILNIDKSVLGSVTEKFKQLSSNDQKLLMNYAFGNKSFGGTLTIPQSLPGRYQAPINREAVNVQVISPLSDSQTMDLASSLRRQTEIALSLSVILRATGGKGEAEAFEKFAKSRQFDIRTITQLTSVNAFSSDGTFGFQVGPRMQAIGGAKKNNGPESIMERQSFPALLVLGLNSVDFQVKLRAETNSSGAVTNIAILEPALTLTQTRRWNPLDRKGILGKDWYNPNYWFKPRMDEDERVEIVDKLEEAMTSLNGSDSMSVNVILKKRIEHLQAQMLGGQSVVYFDPDQVVAPPKEPDKKVELPEFTQVIPDKLEFTDNTKYEVVFMGKNFKNIDAKTLKYLKGGASDAKLNVQLYGDALVVSGTLTKDSTPFLNFQLKTKTLNGNEYPLLTPAVTVVKEEEAKPISINLNYTTTKDGKALTTNSIGIEVSSKLTSEQLKTAAEIIQTELEKNKPGGDKGSANVSVNVQAGNVGDKPPTNAPPANK